MCTLTELTGKDLRNAVEAMPKMYGVRVTTPESTLVYCNPDRQTLLDAMTLLESLSFDKGDMDVNDVLAMLEDRDIEIAASNDPDYCNVYYILNDGTTDLHVVQLDGEPFQIMEWLADWDVTKIAE